MFYAYVNKNELPVFFKHTDYLRFSHDMKVGRIFGPFSVDEARKLMSLIDLKITLRSLHQGVTFSTRY